LRLTPSDPEGTIMQVRTQKKKKLQEENLRKKVKTRDEKRE
jgi:hypothetical protein